MTANVHALEPIRSPHADRRRVERSEAEAAVRTLIRWAGDDPSREGLLETPARVTRAIEEFYRRLCRGPGRHPAEILRGDRGL